MACHKRHFLAAICTLLSYGAIWAGDTLDAEGYPIIYIRGEMTDNWTSKSEYQFSRSDNTYSITLPSLSGEFKIAGDHWEYDFGGSVKQKEDKLTISSSRIITGLAGGENIIASNLHNVSISFNLDKGNPNVNIPITFQVDGVAVPPLISGTLPILYINVKNEDGSLNNEIIDKDLQHKNYFSGEYWLDLNGCDWMELEGASSVGSKEEPLPLEIKARGNFTRKAFSKKPFKLKLESKQKLLGLSKSKHFAILAHADDTFGFMRNFAGFNLGKRIGLPWTPSQQPVEVVINGDYRGLYFLTESIRIDSDRVNIEELDDNCPDNSLISGGYLVELDNYDEENQIRMEEKSCVQGQNLDILRITWDTPEEYTELMKQFVTEQFSAMNEAIGNNSDELWKYMDMDDAARYYIVEEIISHTESYHGSTYLFRDRGEGQKWHFSPLWDCGNAFSGPTSGFFYDHDPYGNTWIPSMRANPTFNDKVNETWLWFMNTRFDGFYDELRDYAAHITEAAKCDHLRWGDAPFPMGGQNVVDNSDMQKRLETVQQHLSRKIEWLKGEFGDYTSTAITSEPTRDDTEAAPLPEYITLGIDNITSGINENEEFFTLQGLKVSTPESGNVYLVRKGDKVYKQIYR